ncbi:hypothetical protein KJ365_02155 [Glaciecola sp. XM2]|uniref:hypothetical protein n=1 Tax=Glaciecola sp. XM2 TaxID=1914931 RepID=UPI001BDF5E8D|nr:hypothetical protein [Glaciecola sp. XM2]MBT1449669.1 hypothetical protein [Glaciecola sp. XM2]
MSYAYYYRRNRVIFVIIMLLLTIGAWLWLRQSGEVTISQTTGVIMEVNQGTTNSVRTGNNVTFMTARIKLEDGAVINAPVFGMRLSQGDRVSVIVRTESDGAARYKIKAPLLN